MAEGSLTAFVSSLLLQSSRGAAQGVKYPNWGSGMRDAPLQFPLCTVFWSSFPTFRECWWFGCSIKINPRILWVLPHPTGRTPVSSPRGDVLSLCNPPGCFQFQTSFIPIFWERFSIFLFLQAGRFTHPVQPLQPLGPSCGVHTGVDRRTSTSPPCSTQDHTCCGGMLLL